MFVVTTKGHPSQYTPRSELIVFITISATVCSCSDSVVLRKANTNAKYSCFDRFGLVRRLFPPSHRVNKLHNRLSCIHNCPSSVWQEEGRPPTTGRYADGGFFPSLRLHAANTPQYVQGRIVSLFGLKRGSLLLLIVPDAGLNT